MPPRRRSSAPPAGRAVKGSVLGGLRLDQGLTSSLIPTMTFEPSIGMVAGRIDKLGMDIRSFREPLTRAVRQVMVPSIRKNFDQQGRPKWEPLSEATREIKARMGFGGRILDRTGDLKAGVTTIKLWTIKQESAIVDSLPSNISYGGIHQGGYGGGSMKKLIKEKGSPKAALEAIMDRQLDIMDRGVMGRASGGREERYMGGGGTLGGESSEIPARPFIMFQPEDEDDIAEVFIRWLDERVAMTWGVGSGVTI